MATSMKCYIIWMTCYDMQFVLGLQVSNITNWQKWAALLIPEQAASLSREACHLACVVREHLIFDVKLIALLFCAFQLVTELAQDDSSRPQIFASDLLSGLHSRSVKDKTSLRLLSAMNGDN